MKVGFALIELIYYKSRAGFLQTSSEIFFQCFRLRPCTFFLSFLRGLEEVAISSRTSSIHSRLRSPHLKCLDFICFCSHVLTFSVPDKKWVLLLTHRACLQSLTSQATQSLYGFTDLILHFLSVQASREGWSQGLLFGNRDFEYCISFGLTVPAVEPPRNEQFMLLCCEERLARADHGLGDR